MDLGLLAVALLSAVVLLLPATALVFTVRARPDRVAPAGSARVVGAAMAVGLATLGLAALLGATPAEAAAVAVLLAGSVLAWWSAARMWAVRGLVAWALTLDAGVLYLGWVLAWTIGEDLGPIAMTASLALWLLELFVFLIGAGYVWEFVDVLARRTWPRYVDPRRQPASPGIPRPFVSLHVPTHNEPPDLVIETLRKLLEIEYDDYEILLLDNNTSDPELWRPVEEFCAGQPRITFVHLEDWPGFKSGALNHGLTRTDPRAEVIGIVDADYLVDPDFLADCAPLFADPDVAFVQTPQDYRGWEQAAYFRRLYYSYGYFFDVSQKSRNERNAAIFGGTMGLIRRSALVAAGGWDEWCITEDAELSLRLLQGGGRGLHIDRSYGRGVMPLTFESLKRQRYRWCFGGVQILRLHWRSLLPGRRTPQNRLTLAQRWGYLVGGLQWFGDLAMLLFTGFLLAAALDGAFGSGLVVRRLSGFLLLAVAALLVLGVVRSLAMVRRTSGATWGEAFGAFGLWIALAPTVARACARGLFARRGVFLRTPKVRGELGIRHAFLGNIGESLLAVSCVLAAGFALAQDRPGIRLVGALLLVQALGYAAAPVNSLAAIRSDLPAELRRRRRLMLVSWGAPARRGGLMLGLAGVSAVVLMLSASPVGMPSLDEVEEIIADEDTNPSGDSEPDEPTTGPGSPTTTSAITVPSATAVPGLLTTPTAAASTPPPATQAPTGAAPTTPPQATPQPTAPAPTTPPQATQQPTGAEPTTPTQAPTSAPTGPQEAPTTRATGRP